MIKGISVRGGPPVTWGNRLEEHWRERMEENILEEH